MNQINITGRLAADIDIKSTQTGKSVCNFTLAVTRPRVKDTTDWIPCVAWNQSAEYLSKYAGKGSRIGVSGTLTSRSYEDKEGNKRTVYEVLCDSVEILESRTTTSPSETPKTAESKAESFAGMEGIEIVDEEELPF